MVSDASFSALGEALCIERDNDGLRVAPLRLCIQFRTRTLRQKFRLFESAGKCII